ncbi:hypothetical protein [Pseudomonas sp. PDM13]|uniref:hypothetical protein n=1 Tax=Pseudomonas sp. PDM13 TaxID=2769255 RepID=UPI0021E071CB|nr:hypothetical protein [Pseudomonas sp. PDM13]MCU9949735.1 hypothetical protein [Pseudomonas sp. PDM13]
MLRKIIHLSIKTATSKYCLLAIPFFALCLWLPTYQETLHAAIQSKQYWTLWYPNIKRVFEVPFKDPQRISSTVAMTDLAITAWLLLITLYLPSYIRENKILENIQNHNTTETIKIIISTLFGALVAGTCAFWYNGKYLSPWGSLLYTHDFLFILLITTLGWTTAVCQFAATAFILKQFYGTK